MLRLNRQKKFELGLLCAVLAIVLAIAGTAHCATTTILTGTIKDVSDVTVTGGKIVFTLKPKIDTTISGRTRFVPQPPVTCKITETGLRDATGTGACVITKNTVLTPAGTYYQADICPYSVCTSKINFFATEDTRDFTTLVPTPETSPYYTLTNVPWSMVTGKPAAFPTTWETVTGKPTTFPVAWPMLAPDGTAVAPSYSFSGATNEGFFRNAAGSIGVSHAGTSRLCLGCANGLTIGSAGGFGWSSNASPESAAADVVLVRDAANTLAQRNSTNAQTFRIYNTYTDASNYERGSIGFAGNNLEITTSRAGTGVSRNIVLRSDSALFFSSGGTDFWSINAANGHLKAVTDNTYDLGQNGSGRPRYIYVASAITVGTGSQVLSASIRQSSSNVIGWTSSGDPSGAFDTGLSRSAAGVLQVGDGGANANGTLKAAGIIVGSSSLNSDGWINTRSAGTTVSSITNDTNGGWEIGPSNSGGSARAPFIDFHWHDTTAAQDGQDYNVRLQNTTNGGLKLFGNYEVSGWHKVSGASDLYDIQLRNTIQVLNKAGNGWITWATRNAGGTEATIDLTNISSIQVSGANLYADRQITFIAGCDQTACPALADTDDQPDIWVNRTGRSVTITEVYCKSNAGTPSITIQNVASTVSTITCTTSGVTGTLTNTTVANGSAINYLTATAGGTAKRVTVAITYK